MGDDSKSGGVAGVINAGERGVVSISVVVPVYNSEGSLPLLMDRLALQLPLLTNEYEVLLVNDGSRDGSWRVIQSLVRERPWLRAINLMRNFGQHNALLCGIRHARYSVIVTLDDDLQNPPEEIPKLLSKLQEGYDVVYGVRQHERHGLVRNLASQMTKLVLQNAMGAETARQITAFRAFRTDLRQGFARYEARFVSIDVLLTWSTTQFSTVRVTHNVREIGRSNYTFKKLVTHTLNMVTGFSVLPLQVASIMGFALTLFGFGLLAFVLIHYLVSGAAVQGFTFITSSIALFSGAQLLALGMIGEYLARMHSRIMDQPSYVVREATPSAADRSQSPAWSLRGRPVNGADEVADGSR